MKRALFVVLVLPFALSALLAAPVAAETGFQLGVPNANVPSDPAVNGLRLSFFWGKNQSIRGVDMGILSLSETDRLSGVGLVFGVGKVNSEMDGGAHFSLINVHTGTDRGLNAAFINRVDNPENAVDFGFVNIADRKSMLDIGGLNVSGRSTAQLGFINVTKHIEGVQLGFINVAENGFLPIFPFFNFPANP